ncbi:MAG: hypothetical protein AB7E96_09755 [Deferribacterales bacterium]
MVKLSANGQKILKTIHLLTAGGWVAGAFTLTIMYFLKSDITDGDVLYGVNLSMHFIDNMLVIIVGAVGCLVTGLVYSVFTGFGFFKHRWIIFKWIVTVSCILFGTFYLGVWETNMTEISGRLRDGAFTDPAYLYNQKMQFIYGAVQLLILIITVFVSVFKPWKKKTR